MKFLKIATKIGFALLAVGFVFLIVYLFGWELLEAPLRPNELTFVMTMADWIDRWLFKGVQWYPSHGAGISVTQATQIGVYYPIVFLHRLVGWSIPQATRAFSFLIVFLVPVEIYFLVWWRFKNQTMALLAAFFFPLSQAAWVQISHLGVLALPFSAFFILPTIFLFDFYLKEKKAKALVLVILSFGLCFLAHVLTAELVTGVLFLWALLFPFLFATKDRWKNLKLSLGAWLKTFVLGLLLVSFWLFPFLRYVSFVSRNLLPFKAIEQVHYITLPFLLGLGDAWGGESMPEAFFALPVLAFALLGVVLAIGKRDKFTLLLSLLLVFFLIYPSLPFLAPWFVERFFMNLIEQSYERAIVIPLVILPVLASYGLFQFSQLFFFWIKKNKIFLASSLAIFLAALGVVFIRHAPPARPSSALCYFGLGPWFYSQKDYCHFWDKLREVKLSPKRDETPFGPVVKDILARTKIGDKSRLDISPNHAGSLMAWPLYSQSSTINIQLNPACLNKIFWGYQVGTFYVQDSSPEEVANLASWFGIEYLVLNTDADPADRYSQEHWQEIVKDLEGLTTDEVLKEKEKALTIKKFKGPAGMVTLSSKPKILIIGKFAHRAYEQFFRLASAGACPYGKAMLVEGKDSGKIDDYSIEELKRFEMILLHGYDYENRERAFALLKNYVSQRGRLFIETGWQYVSPDWEWEKTAEVIPVEKLTWQEYQGDWDSQDFQGFAPPSYRGGPWGSSAGEGLKNWAEPILQSEGKILMAKGEYGQGKIVWSGMNLIGHAFTYNNETEQGFLKDLIDWLIEDLGGEDKTTQIDFSRINPDKIEFTFSKAQENIWLYWRENYYPDWQAITEDTEIGQKAQRKKLKIYRAGPNFMLIPLEKVEKEEKVILELRKSPIFILARVLSILVLVFLIILFFKKDWIERGGQKIRVPTEKGLVGKAKSWWEREEE